MAGVRLGEVAPVVPSNVPAGGQLGWVFMKLVRSVWQK